jgi:hypothetical protein
MDLILVVAIAALIIPASRAVGAIVRRRSR